MAAGDFHTVVRTRTGHLAGFGSSQFGQLGECGISLCQRRDFLFDRFLLLFFTGLLSAD